MDDATDASSGASGSKDQSHRATACDEDSILRKVSRWLVERSMTTAVNLVYLVQAADA
jgi:hypothetical protein